MNKARILGLSITLIFTSLLLSGATNAYAGIVTTQCGSVFEIDSATVFESTSEVSVKINLVNCNNLFQNDDYGAALLTDDALVVTASHGDGNGFKDSELQVDENDNTEHNHLLHVQIPPEQDPDGDVANDCADQQASFEVTDVSFESPGVAMWLSDPTNVDPDMYKIWEVPTSFSGTDAITGDQMDFNIGNIPAVPTVVTFSLTLGENSGEPFFRVCGFIQDGVEADLIATLPKVGGLPIAIDSNALLLAGIQSNAIWMLPLLAGLAGAGAYFVRTRMNKE